MINNTKARAISAASVAVAGSVMLAGCSSTTGEDSGQPSSPSGSPSSSVTRQALEGAPVTGKFANRSSDMFVEVSGLAFGSRTPEYTLKLTKDWAPKSVTGDSNSGVDLTARVVYENGNRVYVSMKNPLVGTPWVSINDVKHTFDVGEVWNTTQGGHKFSVTRQADSNGKVFDFIIR